MVIEMMVVGENGDFIFGGMDQLLTKRRWRHDSR